jgi:hypothetical protein
MNRKNFVRKNFIASAMIATTFAATLATVPVQAENAHWISNSSKTAVARAPKSVAGSNVFPVRDAAVAVTPNAVRVSFHNWEMLPHYIRIEGREVRLEPNSTRTFDIPYGTPVYVSRNTRTRAAGTVLMSATDYFAGTTIQVD